MLRFGRLDHRPLMAVGLATLGVLVLCGLAALSGIRVNTSYSLPLGIYVVTGDENANLIEFCPAEPFASQSSVRGYRTPGLACPDRAVPLLKPIVGRPGDIVEVSSAGISVNGHLLPQTKPLSSDAAGRPLQPYPAGTYQVQSGSVWVASTYHRGSYDSRYMGPIDVRLIRKRLRPLWLL